MAVQENISETDGAQTEPASRTCLGSPWMWPGLTNASGQSIVTTFGTFGAH